jgi:hypothetical protein
MRRLLALLLLAACTTAPLPPSTPPIPSSPPPVPPPPPERNVLSARIHGHVTEPGVSTPAAFAIVTATLAGPGCAPSGETSSVVADERGDYELTVEAGVGPDVTSCVLLSATSAGANGAVELAEVPFRSAEPFPRLRADIGLDAIESMTERDADELIARFVRFLGGADDPTLSSYVFGGPEALRSAAEDYRFLLGDSISARITDSEMSSSHQRVAASLTGTKRAGLSVSVYQDQRRSRRLHSPLLYYSHRSRLFAAAFSRLVAAGDAQSLARLLTADDIDYPVERAERVIAKYRAPFASTGGSFELIDLDEQRSTFTYRLTARNGEQSHVTTIELGYGDGLLWLRDESV